MNYAFVGENRWGFDAKFDYILGFWLEAAWIQKTRPVHQLTHQFMGNLGADYTLPWGNGLTLTAEQLLISYDKQAWAFAHPATLTLFSANYPLGLFDSLTGIVYFDWQNHTSYQFIRWQKTFNTLSLHLMGYWNPTTYQLPANGSPGNRFAGKGIQIQLVWYY